MTETSTSNYKIIIHYSDGTTHEETDFCSYDDLMESVAAYGELWLSNENILGCAAIESFEVYDDGKLLEEYSESLLTLSKP